MAVIAAAGAVGLSPPRSETPSLRGTSDMFAAIVDWAALWKIALVLGLVAMTHK